MAMAMRLARPSITTCLASDWKGEEGLVSQFHVRDKIYPSLTHLNSIIFIYTNKYWEEWFWKRLSSEGNNSVSFSNLIITIVNNFRNSIIRMEYIKNDELTTLG
jgi:hypothetical protein